MSQISYIIWFGDIGDILLTFDPVVTLTFNIISGLHLVNYKA